ncbi:glycosyltransferase family 4 protein [Agrobacterium sp. NPDC090273]|uniref:glycosyltransferase family 4 protein n=1 Tax=Agrobacterium sp. NPDC090273 TaxID=3363919 RepID=UPI00383BA695
MCESIIGGTGSYLAELIPHQVREYGAENIVLLIPESQMSFLDPSVVAARPSIITFHRPRRLWGTLFLLHQYVKTLMSIKPDVVHAHSSIAGLIVRTLRCSRRAKIAFCPHGWSVDMKSAHRIRAIAEITERLLARLPDEIIVISQYEYKRALELGVRPERLRYIANGISKDVPSVQAAEWKDNRSKVLFAGRFDYQKGLDVLLKAVHGLEDRISVRLVGEVAVDGNLKVEEFPPSITKLGWLDRDGVAAQMKSSDIIVIPSRWEGFGLVAVEAMRLSKPVVASAVGGLKEILGNGGFGYLVPPEDDRALHDFLANLDAEDLRNMGERGNTRFLAEYTSDRMVRAIDAVYTEMVGSKYRAATVQSAEEFSR